MTTPETMKRPAAMNSPGNAGKSKLGKTVKASPYCTLAFPGAKKNPPLHYGGSKVYTDTKGKRWRLYEKQGDVVESSYYWGRYESTKKCWEALVKHLKRINP